MSENKLTLTEKNAETKINRLMIFFAAATVAVIALLLINKSVPLFYREAAVILYVIPWAKIVSAIVVIAAAAYWFIARKKQTEETELKIFSPATWLTLAVMLACIVFSYEFFKIPGAVTIIIAFLIFAFIESTYTRDFLVYSVYTCICALLVYVCKTTIGAGALMNVVNAGGKVLAFAIPAAVIAVLLIAAANKGKIGKIKLLQSGDKIYPMLAVSVLAIIGAAATIISGGLMLYALIAIFALYLVIAIVYTIKMM